MREKVGNTFCKCYRWIIYRSHTKRSEGAYRAQKLEDPYLSWFIAWSIVIDYFNLFKTRAVLSALIAYQITRPSLLVIGLVVDYCLGVLIFFVGLILLWWILLPLLVRGRLGIAVNDLSGLVSAVVSVQTHFGITGALFWAGMIPSVWLWLYLVSGSSVSSVRNRSRVGYVEAICPSWTRSAWRVTASS
jgi:hypothetical protein